MAIEVKTQAALDKAIKAKSGDEITIAGAGYFSVRVSGAVFSLVVLAGAHLDISAASDAKAKVTAWGNSTVTAWGNSTVTAWGNSTVTAWGNSTVTAWGNSTVTAWGNSTVTAWGNSTVTAWGNSTVTAWGNSTVTAWGNSTVTAWGNSTVTAWGNSTVTAWGNSTVTAWGYVFVRLFAARRVEAGPNCIIANHGEVVPVGGNAIPCPAPATPASWCEFYGLEVIDGVTTVFKAVGDDFRSPYGWDYTPGADQPPCPDWDGGKAECGGGLHFSPHPEMAVAFNPGATKFLACDLRLDDIAVHPKGCSPEKIKARVICNPTREVDRKGNLLPVAAATEAA